MRRFFLLILLVGCSHEAKRENPFDPVLTPPVELSVAEDDTAGVAVLTWTPFVGDSQFGSYVVIRRESQVSEDTLAKITGATNTTFMDSTLDLDKPYQYRIIVLNAHGLAASSNEVESRPVSLPPVELGELSFDSAGASATLIWTPYRGERFKSYQIWRRTSDLAGIAIAEFESLSETRFLDHGLEGNTQYFYRVVVVTERDEKVPSEERGGSLHGHLSSWSVDTRSELRGFRIGIEPDGLLAVLMALADDSVRLRHIDKNGMLIEDQTLLNTAASSQRLGNGIASVPTGDDQRWLSVLGDQSDPDVFLLQFESGEILETRHSQTWVVPEERQGVNGVLSLTPLGEPMQVDNVRVSAPGAPAFEDNFDWTTGGVNFEQPTHGWEPVGGGRVWALDHVEIFKPGTLRIADSSWRNLSIEIDVITRLGGTSHIEIGDSTGSRFGVYLDDSQSEVVFEWLYTPPEGADFDAHEERVSLPLAMTPSLWRRVGIEIDGNEVTASVGDPVRWRSQPTIRPWVNLALIDTVVAMTIGNKAYVVSSDGQVTSIGEFEAAVSEIRVWQGRRGPTVGVCLPEINQIRFGDVPLDLATDWATLLSKTMGPSTGKEGDFLSHPTSFDVGRDGRFFVLDTHNSRVVVLDAARRYVTEWGSWGADNGQFSLGDGRELGGRLRDLNLGGSIVVDDDGFIYIADLGNQRIQKFAP